LEDEEEFCRQRLLEEDLRAVGAMNEEQRAMHLQWAALYEERLRSLRRGHASTFTDGRPSV